MRITIVAGTDQPGEVAAVEAWFARWREHLSVQSEDQGCGCCVHIWDVDAPADAVADLPDAVQAESDWTRGVA